MDSGWIHINPAKSVKPPKVKYGGKLPFSEKEIEKIFWAVDAYREIYPTTAEQTLKRNLGRLFAEERSH